MKFYISNIFICLLLLSTSFNAQEVSTYNGRLLTQSGEYLEGSFETFYSSGSIFESFQINNGKEHGDYISHYENGNKMEKGFYNYGLKFGKWKKWSSEGVLLSETFYDVNGKKHGSWMIWDNEGHLKALMVYENGKRVGSWKTWGSDGQIAQTINY